METTRNNSNFLSFLRPLISGAIFFGENMPSQSDISTRPFHELSEFTRERKKPRLPLDDYTFMECEHYFNEEDEGSFAVLPSEMRCEVLSTMVEAQEWKALMKSAQVNRRWRLEIDELWRAYCEKNKLLTDEEMWLKKGKNWKWVCICVTRVFAKDDTAKNGVGSSAKNIADKPTEVRFEGEWKDNKKHGVGRIWWSNGDRYLGDWKNDCKDGHGFMIWENGDQYEGSWKNDLREGSNAIYLYANGGRFEGCYMNDERHGPGAYIWPDGDRFEGKWKAGGRNGRGVLITKNGTRIEQEWNESPYVNYSETLPAKFPQPQDH